MQNTLKYYMAMIKPLFAVKIIDYMHDTRQDL